MWRFLIITAIALGVASPASAEVDFSIGIRGSDFSLNLSTYPHLVRVPGYPVYYDPQLDANYFFYDGLYWVYDGDNWYASDWYNGPWYLVGAYDVPLFVLRIPVRYYRRPPVYFRGWRADAPPRWDQHWGRDWNARRGGWDKWDRRSAPPPAPLPGYQRRYSGDRYPRASEQQQSIRANQYRYQPQESVTRQYWQQRPQRASPPAPQRQQQTQRPNAQPQGKAREGKAPRQEKGRQKNTAPADKGRDR
jgi:hypothetical protein